LVPQRGVIAMLTFRRVTSGGRNRASAALGALDAIWLRRRFDLPSVPLDEVAGTPDLTVRPAILDHICLPPYHGSPLHDDFAALLNITRFLKAQTIIDLGTAYGNTVANLCYYFPEATIITVNAVAAEQSGENVTYTLTANDIGIVYRQHGFGKRVQQIYANTLRLDLSRVLPGPVADLAIIDACHDMAFVLNDFEKVRPFMRPNGMVLFHDTAPTLHGHLAGSYRACMRLRKKGFDVVHIRGTWWGMWKNVLMHPPNGEKKPPH
jgi:methyltransferase family protein